MSLRTLPSAPSERLKARVSNYAASAAERFDHTLRAEATDERTINVYGGIGEEWEWFPDEGYKMVGTTSTLVAGLLAKMGEGPVTLNINSPGGDMFEGLAIFNLLREHRGEVNVNVIGVAASAASVVAMAADNLRIGKSAFLMIHNTWTTASGNRNQFNALAEKLLPFDKAMAAIYADRTGKSEADVLALMDAESWISGAEAVEGGFADSLLSDDAAKETPKASVRQPLHARAAPEVAELAANATEALMLAAASLRLSAATL